jgi:hypothetical protein
MAQKPDVTSCMGFEVPEPQAGHHCNRCIDVVVLHPVRNKWGRVTNIAVSSTSGFLIILSNVSGRDYYYYYYYYYYYCCCCILLHITGYSACAPYFAAKTHHIIT